MVSAAGVIVGGDGGGGLPTAGVLLEQPLTTAYLNQTSLGQGTLYITDKVLTWYEDTKKLGFSLEYPNISLHAIRREPIPSLYMMIDCKLELPGLAPPEQSPAERDDSGEESDENPDEDQPLTELMFAPTDQDMLSNMFSAMNECQALHPDPNDSFSDDDDDIYEDASGVVDDEDIVPNLQQPMEAEGPVEDMETVNIDNNGHPANNGNMEYDAEQFADD
ncbi:chloride nucleotide-sensitive channel icln isoform X2 [Arctopsyche grandis]|uniref:chloride nucleotide-sensitive channel icln isoform X2 n=1 Tax=Arctopsyche grandis TaxID=121162 RepID=UPI00406D8A13